MLARQSPFTHFSLYFVRTCGRSRIFSARCNIHPTIIIIDSFIISSSRLRHHHHTPIPLRHQQHLPIRVSSSRHHTTRSLPVYHTKPSHPHRTKNMTKYKPGTFYNSATRKLQVLRKYTTPGGPSVPPEISRNDILTVRGVPREVRATGKRQHSVIAHGTPSGACCRGVVGEPRHVLEHRQPQRPVVDSPAAPEVYGVYRAARVTGDDSVVLELGREFKRNLRRELFSTHNVGANKQEKDGGGRGGGCLSICKAAVFMYSSIIAACNTYFTFNLFHRLRSRGVRRPASFEVKWCCGAATSALLWQLGHVGITWKSTSPKQKKKQTNTNTPKTPKIFRKIGSKAISLAHTLWHHTSLPS